MAEQQHSAAAAPAAPMDASDALGKRAHDALAPDNTQSGEPLVCVTCSASDVKYRCPRCERITCSLACCLDHKKTFACDGKRDRTKYVPLKQFSDADLSSDFFFLEEVARSTSSAARTRSQLGASDARSLGHKKRKVAKPKKHNGAGASAKAINPHVASDWLMRFPVQCQVLVQHAAKRGVALTLLASGMSKRVRNTSRMDVHNDALFWRIEWSFPHADVPVNLFEAKARDSETLFALLAQYLAKCPENAGIRGKLRKYAVADWRDRVLLLLRKEFTRASEPQFYRLDGHRSLESNLKRKAVVEFPVIVVALQEDAAQYPIAHDRIEVVATENHDDDDHDDDANHEDDHDGDASGDDDNGEGNDSQHGGDDGQEEDGSSDRRNHDEDEPMAGDDADDASADNQHDPNAQLEGSEDSSDLASRQALLQAFLADESSVDDLLPSIAEADDELRMFGEDVDGVDFLSKPALPLGWSAVPMELTELPYAS